VQLAPLVRKVLPEQMVRLVPLVRKVLLALQVRPVPLALPELPMQLTSLEYWQLLMVEQVLLHRTLWILLQISPLPEINHLPARSPWRRHHSQACQRHLQLLREPTLPSLQQQHLLQQQLLLLRVLLLMPG